MKQQQYRLTDDEDELPSKVKDVAGGILASLSNNVPAIKRRKENVTSTNHPPTSVLVAKAPPCFSPPTQAFCSPNERVERQDVDRSMDDGISAISCDAFSPLSKQNLKAIVNKNWEETASKYLEEDSKSVALGSKDDEKSEDDFSSSEGCNDSDLTTEFEMNEMDEECDIEEEELESEYDSYESLSEHEASDAELDDDEYNPDEEESGSEEELDFAEEEKTLQRPRSKREGEVRSTLEHDDDATWTSDKSPRMIASPVRDDETGTNETDFETTPAPKISRKSIEMSSPELLVAVVVAEDDGTVDDVLVATILDDHDAMSEEEETDVEGQVAHDNAKRAKSSKTTDPKESRPFSKEKTWLPPAENSFTSAEQVSSMKGTPEMKERTKRRSSKPRKSFYRQEGKVKRGKWTLGAKIGFGSFGVVHVGMNTQNGTLMAVKIFKVDGAVMRDVRREVELMRSLRHQNIVRYFGAQMDKTNLHIFQEWVPGGSVASMLSRFGAFSLAVIRSYLSQTITGLEYLHDNDIMHRDIKGSNILVNHDGVVKLADFGASKKMANLNANLMMSLTVRGTPYFMAPEVFEEKYSLKADIWGVGCVAYQMVTANPPWKDQGFTNPISLFNHIQKHRGPPCMQASTIEMLSKEEAHGLQLFKLLVAKCFEKDPAQRPVASELLREPFFIEIQEEIDDDSSQYPGLFSPGNETASSCDATPNKQHCPVDVLSSFHRAADPSPTRLVRSKSAVQNAFLSPPRPKGQGDSCRPIPLYKSPHQTLSPKPDSTDWPDWALAHPKGQNMYSSSLKKQQSAQHLSVLMGSLALSEDSFAQNPFASTALSKSSLVGSASTSNLIGLDLLERTNAKNEV